MVWFDWDETEVQGGTGGLNWIDVRKKRTEDVRIVQPVPTRECGENEKELGTEVMYVLRKSIWTSELRELFPPSKKDSGGCETRRVPWIVGDWCQWSLESGTEMMKSPIQKTSYGSSHSCRGWSDYQLLMTELFLTSLSWPTPMERLWLE